MRGYPDQVKLKMRMDEMQDIIKDILEEDLPDCGINAWFVSSVHFANMLDKIMDRIWMNV